MTDPLTDPQDIHSMQDLRAHIDALDRLIVDLLGHRLRYIDRAAQIKPAEGMPARIETRVEEVVSRVRARSDEIGSDTALIERLYREMIETSIRREEQVLGKGDQA